MTLKRCAFCGFLGALSHDVISNFPTLSQVYQMDLLRSPLSCPARSWNAI